MENYRSLAYFLNIFIGIEGKRISPILFHLISPVRVRDSLMHLQDILCEVYDVSRPDKINIAHIEDCLGGYLDLMGGSGKNGPAISTKQ